MSLLNKFRAAVAKYLDGAVAQIKKFASAFLPKIGTSVEVAIEEVAQVALQAVVEQANRAVKGEVKFRDAVNIVVDSVSASGKTIAIQTAQAAVQIAYLEAVKIAKETK